MQSFRICFWAGKIETFLRDRILKNGIFGLRLAKLKKYVYCKSELFDLTINLATNLHPNEECGGVSSGQAPKYPQGRQICLTLMDEKWPFSIFLFLCLMSNGLIHLLFLIKLFSWYTTKELSNVTRNFHT